MTHKIRQKLVIPNVINMGFDDKEVDDGLIVVAGVGLIQDDNLRFVNNVRLTMTALAITMTDTGGANGGYGTHKICTLPDTHLSLIGAAVSLSFLESGAGIDADSELVFAIGTAAEATNNTLDSVQANIIASTAATLTTSAAGPIAAENTALLVIDGSAGNAGLFLNLGIPDADISSGGDVAVTGRIDLFYIDIGNDT